MTRSPSKEEETRTGDTSFLFGLQRSYTCLLSLSPSSLSLVPTRLCLHLSDPLRRPSAESLPADLDSGMNYGKAYQHTLVPVSFCQSTSVCIIRGPPMASPRQQIPPILPREELQGSRSMQNHRLPTLTRITVNPTSATQRVSASANPSWHASVDDFCIIRGPPQASPRQYTHQIHPRRSIKCSEGLAE